MNLSLRLQKTENNIINKINQPAKEDPHNDQTLTNLRAVKRIQSLFVCATIVTIISFHLSTLFFNQ